MWGLDVPSCPWARRTWGRWGFEASERGWWCRGVRVWCLELASGQRWNVDFHMCLRAAWLPALPLLHPPLHSFPCHIGDDARTPGITDPTVTHPLTSTPMNSAHRPRRISPGRHSPATPTPTLRETLPVRQSPPSSLQDKVPERHSFLFLVERRTARGQSRSARRTAEPGPRVGPLAICPWQRCNPRSSGRGAQPHGLFWELGGWCRFPGLLFLGGSGRDGFFFEWDGGRGWGFDGVAGGGELRGDEREDQGPWEGRASMRLVEGFHACSQSRRTPSHPRWKLAQARIP